METFFMGCLLLALLSGCATAAPETPIPEPTATLVPPTSTPISPTATPFPTNIPEPTSCEEVEEICLELTFDGEGCTYEGPTDLITGSVTLLFINESEGNAAVNQLRHTRDETIQDMIDYLGKEPSIRHHPSWSHEVGTFRMVFPGKRYTWEGVLKPGFHTMVCCWIGDLDQLFGAWIETGLTVED